MLGPSLRMRKKVEYPLGFSQRIFNSFCAFPQSDQGLSFLIEEMMDPWLPTERPSKTDQTALMRRLI